MKTKILLAEDERKLADTIQSGLYELGYEVAIAHNGQEGKDLFLTGSYDLIVLDINLPFIDGVQLCRFIRSRENNVPIIILTALNFIEKKMEAFESGADDYLAKPFEFRELVARIKALIRRSEASESADRERILRVANLELDLNRKEARRSGQRIVLTATEFLLLEYMVRNKEKVVSRQDLSIHVWETNFDPRSNLVDVYVNFLRKKIDREFSPKLLHTRIGLGYVLTEDPKAS